RARPPPSSQAVSRRRQTMGSGHSATASTEEEIAFIEKIVRPMDLVGDLFGEVSVDDGEDE
ncbi:hypothetical protein, partial [Tistrella bauzanensis]|uniref:hypothetical protein n=1 Tax=Tistrella bauzanensis TaxID=657419 RepID=UPI001E32F934